MNEEKPLKDAVNLLAGLWRRELPGQQMQARVFTLPDDKDLMEKFVAKYDKNQQQLKTLAAMDDLLSGKCYKYMIRVEVWCG